MAQEEKINIELLLETAKAAKSVDELESSINELKDAATQLGSTDKDFDRLVGTAGKLKRRVEETETAVDQAAKGFRGLQKFVNIGTSIAAGFSIAEGAAGLFGNENEELTKSIQKVTSAMAILNGLQEIRTSLIEDSVIATKAASVAQGLYTTVVGSSTGALKAFRLALISTGIGAIVVAIGLLVANWDKLTDAIGLSNKALERRIKLLDSLRGLNDQRITILQKQIQLYEQQGKNVDDLRQKEEKYLRQSIKLNEQNIENRTEQLRDYLKKEGEFENIRFENLKKSLQDGVVLREDYLKTVLELDEDEIVKFRELQGEILKAKEENIDAQIALEEKLRDEIEKTRLANLNFLKFYNQTRQRYLQADENLTLKQQRLLQNNIDFIQRGIETIQDDETMSFDERLENTKKFLDGQKELYEAQQRDIYSTFQEVGEDVLQGELITDILSELLPNIEEELSDLGTSVPALQKDITDVLSSLSSDLPSIVTQAVKEGDITSLTENIREKLKFQVDDILNATGTVTSKAVDTAVNKSKEVVDIYVQSFTTSLKQLETDYDLTLKELEVANERTFNQIQANAFDTALAYAELNDTVIQFKSELEGIGEGAEELRQLNREVFRSGDAWDELAAVYKEANEGLNIFQKIKKSSDEGLFKNDENNLKRQLGLLEEEGKTRLAIARDTNLRELQLIEDRADNQTRAIKDIINAFPEFADEGNRRIKLIEEQRDRDLKLSLRKAGEEFVDIQEDITNKRLAVQKKYKDEALALEKDLAKQIAQQFGDTLVAISSRVANQRIANIERTRDAQLRALDEEEDAYFKSQENLTNAERARLAAEEMFADKREQIERKSAIESARIANKQAMLEWELSLAEATAQAGILVMKALKTGNVVPNVVAGALAGSLGALQIGAVVGAKPQMQVPAFATGGFVSGPGTGTSDSIPALLSNGESVINAKSTSMFAPVLDAINRAGGGSPIIPKFASGSMVTQQTITQSLDTTNLEEVMMAANNRPIKTYVVSSDITNAQHNDSRRKSRTSF